MIGPMMLRNETREILSRILADADDNSEARRLTEEIYWPWQICGVDMPFAKVTGVFVPVGSVAIPVEGTSADTSRRVCFLIDLPNSWNAHLCPWAEARRHTGMRAWVAVGAGCVRLFLWHLLQPLLFLWVFICYYRGLSWLQLAFACVVLCRELLYSVMTVLALVLHPAFLLFDPVANCQVHLNVDWRRTMTTVERRDNEFRCLATGSGATLTLVLAPHFFVYNLLCHLKCVVHQCWSACLLKGFSLTLFIGDLCALGAFVVGSLDHDLELPLLVAYCVSGVGSLVILFDLHGGPTCCGPCLRRYCRLLGLLTRSDWRVSRPEVPLGWGMQDYPLFHFRVPGVTLRSIPRFIRDTWRESEISGASSAGPALDGCVSKQDLHSSRDTCSDFSVVSCAADSLVHQL